MTDSAATTQLTARHVWRGLVAGLLAALSATAAMLFLRFSFQAHMPIELIAEWIPTVTPVSAQAGGIAQFGEALKPLGFTLLLGGQLLLGTFWSLAVAIRRHRHRLNTQARETWWLAIGLPAAAWLILWMLLPPVQSRALELVAGLRACTTLIAREGYAQSEAAIACEGGIWPRKATL
ncbi:MAG: hypothetical protein CL878_14920, partial [Dehalococcoidia bacterium]|nr:hypothetical protein [Dehalococcoidia bacterium]